MNFVCRANPVVGQLGWVDIDLDKSTTYRDLLGLMGLLQLGQLVELQLQIQLAVRPPE